MDDVDKLIAEAQIYPPYLLARRLADALEAMREELVVAEEQANNNAADAIQAEARLADAWNEGHSQALANVAWPEERKGNPYRSEVA